VEAVNGTLTVRKTVFVLVAGPAFGSGRYGLACALVCKIAQAQRVPAITAMHPAMFLRGVSARFKDEGTGEFLRPRSYVMQVSDYVMGALDANLRIVSLVERSPDEAFAARVPRATKYIGWPMLFVMSLKRA